MGPWHIRLDVNRLSLEELLRAVAGRRGLFLDLKGAHSRATTTRFIKTLAGLVRRFEETETARLCGGWPLLDEARHLAPELRVYYSIKDERRWREFVGRSDGGADGVSLHAALLDQQKAAFLHERGLEVFCWPVSNAAQAARLIALGADGLISHDLVLLGSLPGPRPVPGPA